MTQRLISLAEELHDLDGKISRLNSFVNSSTFSTVSTDEQNWARDQLKHMCHYRRLLSYRVFGCAKGLAEG
ncbi:hypothetical protein SEA_PETTERN_8 [Mycobacterium phage PetterN]|uniref:Uncharacterized protein n=1 Tax=Mycobacterium phage Chadwick TaxID=1698366 RepID=A0A0K2CMB4_9CAUD|nr:hypothetical protein AVV06_gp87 [Mycobacterium phage Chadwick]ALA06735.1 hypothetical protein SEA_CHADWICK_8 [Mycobacterium phage Chadwick]QGJ97054.1 hypothetical protein SEA_PETTERN_8 [Mycobacterium phage PetterN]